MPTWRTKQRLRPTGSPPKRHVRWAGQRVKKTTVIGQVRTLRKRIGKSDWILRLPAY